MLILALSISLLTAPCADAQGFLDEQPYIDRTVRSWMAAHNAGDHVALGRLYDDTIRFYGRLMPRSECVGKKRSQLSSHLDYVLMLSSGIHYTAFENGLVRCDFVKSITHSNRSRETPAYLVLKKCGDHYRIVAESDKASDDHFPEIPAGWKEITLDRFAAVPAEPAVYRRDAFYSSLWWLAAVAVVLPAGYWAYRRRRHVRPRA